MDRSRYHQSDNFTRRDGYTGTEAREESKTVDLFCKFRQFRPYLQSRLKKIFSDHKEREFKDEVDDIKYFLSVMSDMLADENHGPEALQGFIDRIHEMVRKNPLSESNYNEESDNDEDDDEPAAPRSPSPTEVTYESGPSATARTIPLERNERNVNNDFNYFDSIERSINSIPDKKKKRKSAWDPDDNMMLDVDMRSEPIFHPTAAHGQFQSSAWLESNGVYRSGFGRGASRETSRSDEIPYEWETRRQNESKQNQGFRMDEPWNDQSSSSRDYNNSFGRGCNTSSEYNRAPPAPRAAERQDFSRDYNHRDHDRSLNKSPNYPRDSSRIQSDDSMFERRQPTQFERRRNPSGSGPSYENEAVHIDYNHGGSESPWNPASSSSHGPNRDLHYGQPNPVPSLHLPNQFENQQQQQHQQQMFKQNMNYGVNQQHMQNPVNIPRMAAAAANTMGMPNMNMTASAQKPHNQSMNHSNLSQGLMGIRPIIPPSNGISAGYPNLQVPPPDSNNRLNMDPRQDMYNNKGITAPRIPEPPVPIYPHPPNLTASNPGVVGDDLKEIFKKKAQQVFGNQSRPNPRRDKQNVPPLSSSSSTSQQIPPPQKSPQNSLLATNQLLSDRDPRLQKLQKKGHIAPHVSSASQNESSLRYSSKEADSSYSNYHRRNENDPRLSRKDRPDSYSSDPRDKNRYNHDSNHSHSSRSREDNHRDYRERDDKERESENRGGERVARVNLEEPYPKRNNMDDARNRVRSRLESSIDHNKSSASKLQEIRKQVEKEVFHPLGRNPSKKHSSFDEAIVVPVPEAPVRPPPKDASSSKPGQRIRESSKETDISASHKEKEGKEGATMEKQKEKEKGKDKSPPRASRQVGRPKTSDNVEKKQKSKKNKKDNVPSSSEASQKDVESTKKPVFRIPKIKKPLPPPPPPSPPKSLSPEPPEVTPEPDTTTGATTTTYNHVNEEPVDLPEVAKAKLKLITDDFIKSFVLAEMPAEEANSLLSNQALVEILKERLRNQVKQIFKEPNVTLAVSDNSAQDIEVEEPETDASETGSHQSRSTVKKRNTKRRSSLEKLHDALKEMRFDAMLPLGPRRCTLGADATETSTGSSAGDTSQRSHEVLNSPVKRASKSTSAAASTSAASNETGDEAAVAKPPGAKRGRKRKRKASKVSPNKKNKGPTTRALQTVKSTIKVQQKEKIQTSTEGTRVTRSMIGAGVKIRVKLEKVKDEPIDDSYNDCVTTGSGMEHLETDSPDSPIALSDNELHAQLNAIDLDIDMPIYHDLEERMSIEIKSEPGSDHDHMEEVINDDSIEQIVEEPHGAKEKAQKNAADTDYSTDLSTFLPDLPTIDNVYYNWEVDDNTNTTMENFLNQIEKQINLPTLQLTENIDPEVEDECRDLLEGVVNEVVEQEALSQMDQVDSNMHASSDQLQPTPSSRIFIEKRIIFDDSESDTDSEEPNNFYQISDDAEEEIDTSEESKPTDIKPSSVEELPQETQLDQDAAEIVKTEPVEPTTVYEEESEEVPEPQKLEPITEINTPLPTEEEFQAKMLELNESYQNGTRPIEFVEVEDYVKVLPTCDPSIVDPEAQAGKVTNMRGRGLYKCPNSPCDFNAINAKLFKEHVTICTFSMDSKSVGCPHCDKRVKAVVNLLDHLKTHGVQKQLCAICSYKTWATSELTRHMKSHHKVYNFRLERMDPEDPDDDPEYIMFPKDVYARISSVQDLKKNYARYVDRLVFSPDDIDKIPNRQIFHTLAFCSICTYSSKVKTNFVRHLQAHKKAEIEKPEVEVIIPNSDPVNPVPCLERKELMFDKMTNWAGSSHENKQGNANSDSSSLPKFVSEQFRYECCVQGCEQITVDEYMLRTHIRTLHPQVEMYKCPHCDKHEATKNDKRNTVPVDKLGNHLKLHGGKLYRCAYCDVIHTQVILMEKHIPEKHPERKPIHYLIRNVDSEGNPAGNRRSSSDENVLIDKWRCTLCTTKQIFTTYRDIKAHCHLTHRIGAQFICCKCKFTGDNATSLVNHVMIDCQKDSQLSTILIMWYRNEFDAKPDDIVHCPLWKRSTSIKHIRGIFLEDIKDAKGMPKLEKQDPPGKSCSSSGESPTKSATSAANAAKKSKFLMPAPANGSDASKIYTCPKCNIFKTKNADNMRVHLYNEMGYQRYRCTTCNVKFVTESSLKGHITGDHGASFVSTAFELLSTDVEIESFVNKFFESHDTPLKKEPSTATFACKHCSQECQTPHNLKTHVLAKHIAQDRYTCGHCKGTFWNDALVRNHHAKLHQDLPLLITEKCGFRDLLTPEFWEKEYGIPLKKKKIKKPSVDSFNLRDRLESPMSSSASSSSLSTSTLTSASSSENTLLPNYKEFDDDSLLFNLGPDVMLLNDDGINSSNNGSTADPFLQQLMGESSANQTLTLHANRTPNSTFAYKCFHCGENSLSFRGARSHWEKVHSNRPEERCNYYEYKTFNDENELPPYIQLTCSQCDFSVSCLSTMYDHHDIKHPQLPFKMKRKLRVGNMFYECASCFHECSSIEQITEHTRIGHPKFLEPVYNLLDLRDRINMNPDFMGKLVEDTVKYTCDDPTCGFEYESQIEIKSHMLAAHGIMSRKINTKYTRYILNPLVKVPISEEVNQTALVFQCPKCGFQSEERHKLIMEHLNEHVHTYLCPQCDRSFRSYLDTKFHIRLQHADPSGTPLINRDMVKAREKLERSITQVQAKVANRK